MLQVMMMFLLYICLAKAENLPEASRQEKFPPKELKGGYNDGMGAPSPAVKPIDKIGQAAQVAKIKDKMEALSPAAKAHDAAPMVKPIDKIGQEAQVAKIKDKKESLSALEKENDKMSDLEILAKDDGEMGPP